VVTVGVGVAVTVGVGVAVGAWAINNNYWGGGLAWGNRSINVNRNTNINVNRNWQHNAEHRHGVRYNNSNVQQKFANRDMRGNAQNRMDFRGHQSLRPRPKPDHDELTGTQLGETEAAQCLHVDEDVRRRQTSTFAIADGLVRLCRKGNHCKALPAAETPVRCNPPKRPIPKTVSPA
jgi:hypothetical protein